jgi:hypothetical protein
MEIKNCISYNISRFKENISMVAEDSAEYFAEKVYRKKLLEIKKILESTNF